MLNGLHYPNFSEWKIVDICHGPDKRHRREKASGIALDSIQKDHRKEGKTSADKS